MRAIEVVERAADKRKELYLLKRFEAAQAQITENNEREVVRHKALIEQQGFICFDIRNESRRGQ